MEGNQTMSDLTPHSRDDLVELPSDCEPPPTLLRPSPAFAHADGCLSNVSAPLCECKRLHRGQLRARLEASVRLLQGDGRVVDLAAERRKRGA
jgi:hypothetical protein